MKRSRTGELGQPHQKHRSLSTRAPHRASIDSISTPTSESTAAAAPAKKRTLRKGTFSCIECKRRKAVKNLVGTGQRTCVSCQRHSTPCIGQENTENTASSQPLLASGAAADDALRQSKYRDVGRRICEVEALVHELMCRQIIRGMLAIASCESDDDDDGGGDGDV